MPTDALPATPPAVEASPPPRDVFFRHRGTLGIAVAAFLVLFPWGRSPMAPWQLILGAGLVLAGVALRLWCILQLGGAARKTSTFKAVQIVSWGPYAMVRNPIYIANTTVFMGFTVLSGLLWAAPIFLIVFGLWYNEVVRREEAFLRGKFPEEFGEYARSTRRWIPRWRFRSRPPELARYPFLRALKRERAHLIVVSLGAALVVIFRILLQR